MKGKPPSSPLGDLGTNGLYTPLFVIIKEAVRAHMTSHWFSTPWALKALLLTRLGSQ